MISEKDVKALNGVSVRQYRITLITLIALGFFQLYLTYNNFSLAINYGQAMGLNFKGILSLWNAEPELNKQYIGYEVQSLRRLNMAILNFGLVIIFTITAVSITVTRNRNKRVLASLEKCGAIKLNRNA